MPKITNNNSGKIKANSTMPWAPSCGFDLRRVHFTMMHS
jgi:hypothetical protein